MNSVSREGLEGLIPERGLSIRAELLEPLERAAQWLVGLTDGQGRLICPEHKLEHTGKSACAAILFAHLWVHGAGEVWLERAIAQGRRLVLRLEREGDSPCHTFRPGRHDPFNCSNSVIDGGACADALATLVAVAGERLCVDDAKAFEEAAVLHARTYLRYAVLDKGIPAQRAWGMTGLAGAYALSRDPELAKPAIEAVGVLEAIQNPDGSYPYHPLDWGAGHPGASDVSCFYQSRVTGFLMHSLLVLGRDPNGSLFRQPLGRGLNYLKALIGPDGIKPGLLEAKPWYWGAEYEVASHVFDVHALALGGRLFKDSRYGDSALASFRAWAEHLGEDGQPRSHIQAPGRRPSYQCPLFWASHACWVARVLPELEQAASKAGSRGLPEPARAGKNWNLSVWTYESAQLARLDDGRLTAFIRGSRPPGNAYHGGPVGAGLLRLVRSQGSSPSPNTPEAAPLAGCIDRRPFQAPGHAQPFLEGEWFGHAGYPSPMRGLASGREELRFSLWQARVERRAGRSMKALATPFDVFKRGVLDYSGTLVSSAFDRAATLHALPDGILVRARLCHRDGRPVPGSALEREFRLGGEGLSVEERLISSGAVRRLGYRLPRTAQGLGPDRPRPGTVLRGQPRIAYSMG